MADQQSITVRRALISLSDKSGLVALARGLIDCGVELLSTGGTARALAEAGFAVTEIESVTGFPEILGGRVKTLHPRVHGGLLGIRGDARHEDEMRRHGIRPIDLLAVTLYPFEAARARGAAADELIETIDIGGPAMIRAAAKNSAAVTVIVDPDDYPAVVEAMRQSGGMVPAALRQALAAKAFARTAAYDAMISHYLASRAGGEPSGGRQSAAGSSRGCATARTRSNGPPFTPPASPGRAWRAPASCKGRNSPTTISTMPTRPSNASPSSLRMPRRPA